MNGPRPLTSSVAALFLLALPAVGPAQTTPTAALPVVCVVHDRLDVVEPARLGLVDPTALRSLKLRSSSASRVLQQLSAAPRLEHLSLEGCPIGDDDCRRIGELTGLRSLSLASTRVTDRGVRQLVALERLRRLDLRGTRLTDDGLAHVAKLPALREVDVRGSRVSVAGVARLRNLRPQLEILGPKLRGGSILTAAADSYDSGRACMPAFALREGHPMVGRGRKPVRPRS